MKQIKYGGAITGSAEENAIIRSIRKSQKTANWQKAEQGDLMEKECANYLGVKYGVLTNSGSSAGLLALSALELPKGGEVIISAVTFPTIFNIILQCGLVPVVVDAKVGTYNFDIADVERAITDKTVAIIAIHAVGNPCDMPALMSVVKDKNPKIYVLEDNCDGWGSTINGKKVGSFGDVSITSFHAAHIVSMGVGGGVFTSDPVIAKNARMYCDWGRQANITEPNKYPELPTDYNPRFIYEKIGYNFQILELQAAMGRVQLKKTTKIKQARKKNFDYLTKHLAKYPDITLPAVVKGADVCWFALPLTYAGDRGKLVTYLEEHGIETRSMFAGNILRHPAYKDIQGRTSGTLEGANYILGHSFWISVHPRLTKVDLKYMCNVFDKFFKN
jgi:CDP-4-dehydro-6-deoxyglucose reductase, E1